MDRRNGYKIWWLSYFFASILYLIGDENSGVLTCDKRLKKEAKTILSNHRFGDKIKAAISGDVGSTDTEII